jgi:hypothetical protein
MDTPRWMRKIVKWGSANQERLLLFLGLVSVGALCFEAGMLYGSLRETEPLKLSISAQAAVSVPDQTPLVASSAEPIPSGSCLFVGSRNSDKYHLPKCSSAKRIKPENRVCFASEEDAKKRGYVAGCLK